MDNPYAPPGDDPRPESERDGRRPADDRAGPTPGPQLPTERRDQPARPPGPTPPLRPMDPDVARSTTRLVLDFTLLVLAALLTMMLPLPWQLGSLVFAVAGLVVGVRALRKVWRSSLRQQLAPLLLFGVAFAALMILSMSAMLAFWPAQVARQECLGRAVTIDATEQCEIDFQESLTDRLGELTDR